jgi:transposase
MPNPYPEDLRERVVQAYEAGEGGYAAVGAHFCLGHATVSRWVSQQRSQGHLSPRPKRGGTPSTISAGDLAQLVDRLRDPTAHELTAEFNRTRRGANRVHVSSMKRALHRCGYVVKKNVDGHWRVCGRTSSRSAPPT